MWVRTYFVMSPSPLPLAEAELDTPGPQSEIRELLEGRSTLDRITMPSPTSGTDPGDHDRSDTIPAPPPSATEEIEEAPPTIPGPPRTPSSMF